MAARVLLKRASISKAFSTIRNASFAVNRNFHVVAKSSTTRNIPSLTCSVRHASQAPEEEQKQISWLEWLFGQEETETQLRTAEEDAERRDLLQRIHACYYAKPPHEPGKELFIEAFHLLIKYDDLRGVENAWGLLEEAGHELDDDMIDKIEDYLIEARARQWTHPRVI